MKYIIILLTALMLVTQNANAIIITNPVIIAPHQQEEKAPWQSCYMQERVEAWLWRCYTEQQWNEKQTVEKKQREFKEKIDKAWWETKYWEIQAIINWICLGIVIILAIAFMFLASSVLEWIVWIIAFAFMIWFIDFMFFIFFKAFTQ